MWKRQQREDWTSKEKHRQLYFKSDKVNGAHALKAGGHTSLLGTSKSGRLEITEDSITGLRRHSVDMGVSASTCSRIKSEAIQPARTVALDRMTRNTRYSAAESTRRSGTNCNTVLAHTLNPSQWSKLCCLGQDCVLLQARNHKKDGKRSGNTANDQPRTLGLEGQCSKRCMCLCTRK